MWIDGICRKCGSIVLESCITDFDDAPNDCDYKNRCTNSGCVERKWHYVGDQEELEYYYHNPRLAEDERFKKILEVLLLESKEWRNIK